MDFVSKRIDIFIVIILTIPSFNYWPKLRHYKKAYRTVGLRTVGGANEEFDTNGGYTFKQHLFHLNWASSFLLSKSKNLF